MQMYFSFAPIEVLGFQLLFKMSQYFAFPGV